jgi:hypothetical protein
MPERAMQWWTMALSVGAMLLGAVLLYLAITNIFRLLRESEVARVPAAAEVAVTFSVSGTYVLHIDQPRLSLAMYGAKFALRDVATETEARSSPVIFRTTTAGFSRASVSVRYFEIERAGDYRLLVTGIDPAKDVSRVELVLTRPYAGTLFALIVGTVFGGMLLIGGLVFTALQYSGKL